MKRIVILALILFSCVASVAWAEQQAARPRMGKHSIHRRILNSFPKANGAPSDPIVAAQAAARQSKVWEFGTFPGGTWASMGDINDFGIAVAQGDVADGSTHNLAVPLFGRHAGEWIDLGTLGGTEAGWDEGLVTISDTGLIVGHSASADENRPHGIAWTAMSGIVDLGTLADIGYSTYNSSYAAGVNKVGTLIVGWSGVEESCINCAPTLPVVWTPSLAWKNGRIIVTWTIHKLDTTGFDDMTRWFVWAVNDFGQIVGEGNSDDGSFVGVLWTPLKNGSWKLTRLPVVAGFPVSEPDNHLSRHASHGTKSTVCPCDSSACRMLLRISSAFLAGIGFPLSAPRYIRTLPGKMLNYCGRSCPCVAALRGPPLCWGAQATERSAAQACSGHRHLI